MKKIAFKMSYLYIPQEERLWIMKDGKNVGGFLGEVAHKKFYELLETGAEINIGKMDTRKPKIRQLRALWIKQGCDQFREYILEPYGVTSTADLTEPQLDELILRFSHDVKSEVPVDVRNARSLVLKLLTELGVYDNTCDWKHVNAYLLDKRIAGKLLFQMSVDEMRGLATKLRAILQKKVHDDGVTRRLREQN